jgi:hypothetical protein
MRTKDTTVAEYPVTREDKAPAGSPARLATIAALEPDGTLMVDLGEPGAIVPARLAVRVGRERIEAAMAGRHQVVLLFEDGDPLRPLIVGFIETVELPVQPATPPAEQTPHVEVDADGRRLKVTAKDEIVLRCGKASITLRRNGRVIVRGTYVESHSDGTNRIKGGQVQIN